jgi:hypothetical protein
MANHCVDVICTNCGAMWCARGCGTRFPPDEEFLKKWKKENKNIYLMSDITCPHCSSNKVASN